MSSRALRRLREEKEAALAAEAEEGEEESSEEEEEDDGGNKGGGGFMMMLEEESSSEEESESSDDGDEIDGDDDDGKEEKKVAAPAKSKKTSKEEKILEEEEDLDAILSDLNIQSSHHDSSTADNSSPAAAALPTIRSLLLSKQKGFDVQDLDLDYAMRSLLGGAGAAAGDVHMGDDIMGAHQPQPQGGRRGRGGGNNQRGRRTLAKKYLFGKPKNEWGKPPSYVGGGIGTKELTKEILEEERRNWSVPWPYNLETGEGDENGNDAGNNDNSIPTIPLAEQRWFALQMSDTYQEHNYIYQEMLSTQSTNRAQGAGMHDPNSLAMFVADHPYFAETILQLAMVLYYINDRGRGNDLLRRCLFLYEAALPSNVLPSTNGDPTEVSGAGCEILLDIDRQPNSGLFATLFRIMQTSGMTGCHDNALATGRYLLSLDPLRDPMGVLPVLDYYALASRRTSATYLGVAGEEADVGAAFIVDLVEGGKMNVHYKDPLTDRHHWCRLADMPNWAYSHALALYRLSISAEDDSEEGYQERAAAALMRALEAFPMVLPKLLDMNKVNTRDRSFRTDWFSLLAHFDRDAIESSAAANNGTVEERVTRASGEHLVRIFVQRCHKLWKEDHVVQWMHDCAARLVKERGEQQRQHQQSEAEEGGAEKEQTSAPVEGAQDSAAEAPSDNDDIYEHAEDANNSDKDSNIPPLISVFSPALARYAQCDPSEYEDAFRTFPPEAIALDPNIVAPAMALGPDGRRRRMFRRGQQHQQQRGGREGGGGMDNGELEGQDALGIVRQMLGLGGAGGEEEMLDPDSPLLQLYLQSLLPWAQVEGVRPPPRG